MIIFKDLYMLKYHYELCWWLSHCNNKVCYRYISADTFREGGIEGTAKGWTKINTDVFIRMVVSRDVEDLLVVWKVSD